jgi:hypothetical protein
MKMKKEYEPPKIIHTERLEARAITCGKNNDAACGYTSIQS